MATTNDHSLASPSSLSAMFDGEATEQDIESLLNESHIEISRQLESFHLIQQTLHKESKVSIGLQGSLVSRIRAEIDAEDGLQKGMSDASSHHFTSLGKVPESITKDLEVANDQLLDNEESAHKVMPLTWKTMFSNVAIAASVTFVVIFGGNLLLTPEASTTAVVADVQESSIVTGTAIASLDELKNEALPADNIRLQHYLRQHAEQAAMAVGQGMIPMARVVSYPVEE